MDFRLSENVAHKIYSILPDAKVFEAYQAMKERRIRHLLVVEKDNRVVGVISDRDIQRAISTKVEKTDNLKIIDEHFNPADEVQDYMTWNICKVTEETPLKEVAYLFLEKKISSVVVTNGGNKVVGIMTTDDLLWVLVQLLDEKDHDFIETLKLKVMNSPLGMLANSLSQSGI